MVKLFFKVGYWILVLSSSMVNVYPIILEGDPVTTENVGNGVPTLRNVNDDLPTERPWNGTLLPKTLSVYFSEVLSFCPTGSEVSTEESSLEHHKTEGQVKQVGKPWNGPLSEKMLSDYFSEVSSFCSEDSEGSTSKGSCFLSEGSERPTEEAAPDQDGEVEPINLGEVCTIIQRLRKEKEDESYKKRTLEEESEASREKEVYKKRTLEEKIARLERQKREEKSQLESQYREEKEKREALEEENKALKNALHLNQQN